MIVLEKYKLVEKLVGFNPHGGVENTILRIVYMVTFISFNIMELIFVILNVQNGFDRLVMVTAICAFCGVVPVMFSYAHLWINLKRYYALLDDLQQIINESE